MVKNLVPPSVPSAASSDGRPSQVASPKQLPVRKTLLKAPRASDLSPQVKTRKPPSQPTAREAPIQVDVRRYTEDASYFVQTFPSDTMWQVQVVHDARPSVVYNIVRLFNEFLVETHATNDAVPGSLGTLFEQHHIKLVLTDKNDPDSVGFVQWRVAFYVAGTALNLRFALDLLDHFFRYRERTETDRPFARLQAVYTITTLLDTTLSANDFEVPSTVVRADVFQFPFYAAAPPFGRRLICCIFDVDGDNISAVVTGNTYPFRALLDAAEIGGDYAPADDDGRKDYFRVFPSEPVDHCSISATLAAVFKGSTILCAVRGAVEPDSPAANLLDELRGQTHLEFVKDS